MNVIVASRRRRRFENHEQMVLGVAAEVSDLGISSSATISLKLGPKILNLSLKPQSKMRYEIFDCNARAGTPEVC